MSYGVGPAQPGATSVAHSNAGSDAFWDVVRLFVESRLSSVDELAAHGLGAIAADVLELRGSPVADRLLRQQHLARVAALTAPLLLERVRAACDGPILVLKGPEVAARYPNRARAFGDVDLLVPDARRVQRELVAGGFVEEDDPEGIWVDIHHLGRLRWPGIDLAVEIHSEPKWLDGVRAPRNELLFEEAVPATVGVTGVLAPAPAHHVLLLAAHAWAHQPLGRARDLVDVGALRRECDVEGVERLARAWGLARVWSTTSTAIDAVLARRRTWPVRLWASHLPELRDQTVLEQHLERLFAPFWGYPTGVAVRRTVTAFFRVLRPASDEGWGEKLKRTVAAMRRPLAPISEHRRRLGASANRGARRDRLDRREP